MQIPILKGRSISAQDGPASPRVIVISESVARFYWPTSNPVGQRIRLVRSEPSSWTVVGVCGDIKEWFGAQLLPSVYLPFLQAPQASMRVLLRVAGDPLQQVSGVRAKVREVDVAQPVYNLKTTEQIISEETSGVRIAAQMMILYAVIAFVLSIIGIYSVASFLAEQRTYEIGVRMALGARGREVLLMLVKQSLRSTGLGLALGLMLSFALVHVMSSLLYNVVVFDLMTLGILTASLALCELLATCIPALRATSVQPVLALRHE